MPAPPNYVFTIFSFVAFFLCLIKFPTQFNAWSVGPHLFLIWVGPQCLILGINSIIWNHNTVNWAPVWCDITARFNIGLSMAIPASILCINRRLYMLASPTSIIPSEANKKRHFIIDLVIGIGLPIIGMALSFVTQTSRFQIVEDYGCDTAILPTWVTMVLSSIPPIVLEFIAGIYGCLSIRAFYRRSKESEIHNYPTRNRYIRLICFSTWDLLSGLPITLFFLYVNNTDLVPFPGLTHEQFSEIVPVPAVEWRANARSELIIELSRWIIVYAAFVFFAVFGFTAESRNNYRAMIQSVVQVFVKTTGVKSRPSTSTDGKSSEIMFYKSRTESNS